MTPQIHIRNKDLDATPVRDPDPDPTTDLT